MILKTSYKMKPPPSARLIKGHPLARGLVGCWLMNEGGGDKVFDLSGNGNHGTGSLVWVPGPHGMVLDNSATGHEADTTFNGTQFDEITICVSAKTEDETNVQYIIDNSPTSTGFGLRKQFENFAFFCHSGGAHGTASFTLDLTLYHQYTCVHGPGYQSAGIDNTIFVDGLYRTHTDSASGIDDSSDCARIGAEYDGTDDWKGQIEYVLIYNRALTVSEVKQLYVNPFCMFDRRGLPVGFETGGPPPPAPPVFGSLVTDLWYIKHKQGLYSEI